MALKFFNIRTGETVTAEEEPQIAALLESSDRSTNITQGQDFGWRLAPEVVAQLEGLKRDNLALERIAHSFKKEIGELTESDLIFYLSRDVPEYMAPTASDADYADAYSDALRKYQKEADIKAKADAAARAAKLGLAPEELGDVTEQVVTTTTTQSIEDLEAEIARRKAEAAASTTTTTTVKNSTGNSRQNQ